MNHVVLTLQTSVLDSLRSSFPRAFREENINKKGYIDKLSDAVVAGKTSGERIIKTNINIRGFVSRGNSSGTYRLRFFENPVERTTKKKGGRGKIQIGSDWFFKRGYEKVNIKELVENHMRTYFN